MRDKIDEEVTRGKIKRLSQRRVRGDQKYEYL
jgi:hypothetical protein